jgi:DNA modification methylase
MNFDLEDNVFLGDCLKGMSELPAELVDAIITDPPYNTGMSSDMYGEKEKKETTLHELYALGKEEQIRSILSVSARKGGPFEKVRRGVYTLRK